MSEPPQSKHGPLLTPGYRGSGLLLHVTSLPSRYGIGDFGAAAVAWIDRLHAAEQTWWQGLPLGPTGYANSPYQSLSSFAGNWLLISPDGLLHEGLLNANDLAGQPSFSDTAVDFDAVIRFKQQLLLTVWSNFRSRAPEELQIAFQQFCEKQAHWLDDFGLFCALKARYHDAAYLNWPTELVLRDPASLKAARHELADDIERICLSQFLLLRQGEQLKGYAHAKGVRLIGDLPFFVSPDSSDVWADPQLFQLDEHRRPRFVAGVPPDYFSAQGQLWGNPVYDWQELRKTGFRWWINRVRALLSHVDLIRLDHFRGFAAAWHVPAGAPTAQTGQWVPGPGAEFFAAVEKELGSPPFIAEDLGLITADVRALRDQFQLPGMRVLQFAFDGMPDNPYLPENFVENTVVYTGTHDNDTTRGWYAGLPDNQRQNLLRCLKATSCGGDEAAPALMQLAWSSSARLALAPLQDLLNLGSDARMNVPGRVEDNWRWRVTEEMLASPAFDWLRQLTERSGRSPAR
jgi:4-alpha-glucanotransferase